MVLLEAMYCGVPAVASDIRGVRDVMKNGVTGILCGPDDSRAFAAAIQRLKKRCRTSGRIRQKQQKKQ